SGHYDVVVDTGEKLAFSLILFYTRYDPRLRQAEVRELPGRAERSRVGDYRIGELEAATRLPGRHLVWTTADRAARLPSGAEPVGQVPLPDAREHYVLLAVSGVSGAR
ncbi:MAG TPA: hypothetical protein VGQ18_12865, partial [Gemmatimonadales bacterium]|nr:hypothetical protein [Gemmatimonadales bacterium]